jgi:hypothetical protein
MPNLNLLNQGLPKGLSGVPIPKFDRIPGTCRRWGWNRTRLYHLIGTGAVRALKDGKAVIIDQESCADYIESLPVAQIGRYVTATK